MGELDRPIFIGGAGRSGTTLLRTMLDAHPSLHCPPELKLVPIICSLRDGWMNGIGPQLEDAGVSASVIDDAMKAFVETFLLGASQPGTRLVEKTPPNVLVFGYLGQLFPDARFIHVVRDPRAVSRSLASMDWFDSVSGEPLWYTRDIPNAASYWAQSVMHGLRQEVEVAGRVHRVRYEELVQQPRTVMEGLLSFLGEPFDERVLAHEQGDLKLSISEASTEAVQEAVHARRVDAWRDEMTPEEIRAVEDGREALMDHLGYAPIHATKPA